MAYELGAGLGIALFGLILTRSYSASIALPSGLSGAMAQQAASSIGEAVSLSRRCPPGGAGADGGGEDGFIQAHSPVLATAGVLLLLLAAGIWRSLATVAKPQSAHSCSDRSIAARRSGARAFFNAAALTVAAGTDIQGGHHLTVTRQHGYRQRAQAYLDLPVGEGIALHAHPGDLCT